MATTVESTAVQRAIEALQKGQFVLLYDADGREEETDLVVPSQLVTPAHLRTLRTAGGGLICTTVHPRHHGGLGLPYMADLLAEAAARHPLLGALANAKVPYEGAGAKSSFALSINHRETFTGVTDADRALTIRRFGELLSTPREDAALQAEFVRQFKAPGHVFLLNAHPKLLEARRGHTELSTVLVEMAGLTPSATICEMMNGPSGRALPKADAIKYAAQNGLVFLEGHEVLSAWQRMGRHARSA